MAEEENTQVNDEGGGGDAAAKAPAQPTGKSPIVLILSLVNTIGLAAIAFFQFQFMQEQAKKPDLAELLKQGDKAASVEGEDRPLETINKEVLVNLETFTVNLAQGDGPRRYVRLNTVLKMSTDSEISEIEARKPQIRDTIISILNSKRPEDLLKRDGKLYLKDQIKSAINAYLIDGKVEDLFYVGFQIN